MKFSIITPSLNQLDYLKRCMLSVADQQGVDVEHIVIDGGSTDGTVEWLRQYDEEVNPVKNVFTGQGGQRVRRSLGEDGRAENSEGNPNAQGLKPNAYSFSFSSEKDEGMYDALNKGFHRASGDVLAWLNCDEQYLPDALNKAAEYLRQDTSTEILFGGMLMTDADGGLLACRKAMPMRRLFLEASYLYNFSCAMFVRREFWSRLGGFNPKYKNAGDEEWIRRAVSCGANTSVLREYLSVFCYTNENLSSAEGAYREHEALKSTGHAAVRRLKVPINLLRLSEKALRGGWLRPRSLTYRVYAADLEKRRLFHAIRPSCRWPDKHAPYLTSHRLK